MNLYPAIDMYGGQVVRLERGDFNKKTVYNSNPIAQARHWEEQGAKWIHIVDLGGAKTGNLDLMNLVLIRKSIKCKIQFGGGIRSIELIRSLLREGIDRVVIGTKAMDETFLKEALDIAGSQLAIGLDIRDGVVQTQGWLDSQNPTLEEAIRFLNKHEISTVIYTDIKKDGMLSGPNWSGLKEVMGLSKAKVILSGGISDIEDIKNAAELNDDRLEGVIIGKALYENKFKLKDALVYT